ncbi:MAG: hypothetical protein MJ143_06035 [Clostridia bacterium]|nr:hypothetical protein [Clostridia bacterium]
MLEKDMLLNEKELNEVSGGVGGKVCIKDSSVTMANANTCSGCRYIQRDASYSGRGYDCKCRLGIPGVWRE